MPRPLPWRKDEPAPSRKRAPPLSSASDRDQNVPTRTERKPAVVALRTPSSSPPPIPPESISAMKTGVDDAWMMVEDEFLSTAQTYTRHIHHAEYKRLQKEARLRRQDGVVKNVNMPNKTTTFSKAGDRVEEKLKELDARMDIGREKLEKPWDSDEDQEENILINDRNLAGLMFGTTTSKACGKSALSDFVGPPKSKTRAAAGLGKQESPRKRRYLNHVASLPEKDEGIPRPEVTPRQRQQHRSGGPETKNNHEPISERTKSLSAGSSGDKRIHESHESTATVSSVTQEGNEAAETNQPPPSNITARISDSLQLDDFPAHRSSAGPYPRRRSRQRIRRRKTPEPDGIEEIPLFLK